MAITESVICKVGQELYTKALKFLPLDILEKLKLAQDQETNKLGKLTLQTIIENATRARERGKVICQDTCISSFKVKVGTEVKIQGDISRALKEATARSVTEIPAIPHCVHPLSLINPGTGVGPGVPLIHFEMLSGADYIELSSQPVSGGGELVSACKVFTDLEPDPVSVIKKFVVETVAAANSKPCPPIIVGVGLGSQFEMVTRLAKDAVMRPLDVRHPEKEFAELEGELFSAINGLGIGPMGLGGKTTCLAVNLEYGYTYTSMLPIAVKISCWCVRRAAARIYADGRIQYL